MNDGLVDALQRCGAAAGAFVALIFSLGLGGKWTGIGRGSIGAPD